jgi:hypothetical protein
LPQVLDNTQLTKTLRESLRECPRTGINTGPYERLAEGSILTAEVGWAYQTITKEQVLHADDLAVRLDMNRGHLSDIERGKREAGIITLQIIALGLDTTSQSA